MGNLPGGATVKTSVTVVAAVIKQQGRILICQRSARDSHPLKWEFPGGKMRPGETPRQALARELDEELGIRAEIGEELARYRWQYPGAAPIELIFYSARVAEGEPVNRVFAQILWETPDRLAAHDFLDADREFVGELAKHAQP
ncbi:MAG: (deoxy)nucleoside triphosphate pyrophosphohydrolase [Bryobacteraceae bacterium]